MRIAATKYNKDDKAFEIHFNAPGICSVGYDPEGSIFEYIIRKLQEETVDKVWVFSDIDSSEFSRWLQLLWSFTAKDIWLYTNSTKTYGPEVTDFAKYIERRKGVKYVAK